MDTLDDAELESIWRRIKRYIPTSRISGKTQQEVLQQIDQYMRDAGDEEGKQGSMDSLIKNGFATENAFGRTKEFQSSLDKWITAEQPSRTEQVEAPQAPTLFGLPKVNIFSSGRASIATRRGKRVYAQKNLRVSYSTFKGKQSYYIYNIRTKKRITWGVKE